MTVKGVRAMKKVFYAFLASCFALGAQAGVDREFLKSLIAIPSETRDAVQCGRAVEAYRSWLEARGVVCTVMTNGVGRKFLYAATSPGLEHDFVFVTHLDVVPAADPSQYVPRVEGDVIYGRGACDTKGNAVVVAEVLAELVGKASAGAVVSTDEEGGSGWRCGTAEHAVELGVRPRRMVLVGDSAGEAPGQLFVAEKGHLRITLTARGKGGHSSVPWSCDNPVTRLVRAGNAVLDAFPVQGSATDNWHNVLSPTMMAGSKAMNIIPDAASMSFSYRYCNPGDELKAVQRIRELTGLEVTHPDNYLKPVTNRDDDPLIAALFAAMKGKWPGEGIRLGRMSAATDASQFVRFGLPTVIFASDAWGAHSANERGSLSKLDDYAELFVSFIRAQGAACEAPRPVAITAAGDAFMVQAFPPDYAVAPRLRDWILSGDARLVNFEAVVNDGSCIPAAHSGGTWASMSPSVFPDLWKFGFNGCGCANNHSLDYTFDALRLTMKTLREADKPFAGIGEDLQSATAPAYVDTPAGRVAFVSVSASFHEDARAGWSTSRVKGRPGLNPLRSRMTYLVKPERLAQLKEIAAATGVNGNRELNQRTGFTAPDADGSFVLGGLSFKASETEGQTSTCDARDLKRICESIAAAKREAVAVVVLAHCHTMRMRSVEEPADFFVQFCRAAIDAGADAVVGGGTHQLKGIAFHKGRPIFYSLGDFVFQNSVVPTAPPDFCEQYGVPVDSDAKTAFAARSKGGKVGLHAYRENFLSVVPKIELEPGRPARVTMLPIELHYGCDWSVNGLPRPADAEATKTIADTLTRLSAPMGTTIVLREDGMLEAEERRLPHQGK